MYPPPRNSPGALPSLVKHEALPSLAEHLEHERGWADTCANVARAASQGHIANNNRGLHLTQRKVAASMAQRTLHAR